MARSLLRRISLLAALLLLMSGVTGLVLLYQRLSSTSELDVLDSYRQAVKQAAINLNDRMGFADKTLQSLLADSRLQESVLRAPSDETMANQLVEIKSLRELVYSVEKNEDIQAVRVFLSDEKILTREGINFFSLTNAYQTKEYERMLSANGAHVWLGLHTVKTTYYENQAITLGCLYRSYFMPVGRNWAMILIDLVPESFSGILDSLSLKGSGASVLVTDEAGEVMFGTDHGKGLASVQAACAAAHIEQGGDLAGFCLDAENSELAFICRPLGFANWRLMVYLPRSNLLNSRQSVRHTLTLLLIGLTLLIIAMLGIFFLISYTRFVNNYIRSLSKDLRSHSTLKLKNAPNHWAVYRLNQSISELLSANEQLTQENYRSQLREREITLQALQAQINPHFLYNTLDSINWMAMRHGAQDVSDAIAALADYFRLSLSRGKSIVSLREETEITRRYLALYEHRSDFRFQVDWDIHPDTIDCPLPKLTMQPLVENALLHGIFCRREKEGGIIRIASGLIHRAPGDSRLVLTVEDNGPGLPPDSDIGSGYGLKNVRSRLDLYFNGQYTLSFDNRTEGGAVVTVEINTR